MWPGLQLLVSLLLPYNTSTRWSLVCPNFGHHAQTSDTMPKLCHLQNINFCRWKNILQRLLSFEVVLAFVWWFFFVSCLQHLQSVLSSNSEVRAECPKLGHTAPSYIITELFVSCIFTLLCFILISMSSKLETWKS